MATVFIESYELPSVDTREALRYAGYLSRIEEQDELISRLDEAISLIEGRLTPRVCFCELDVSSCDFGCSLDIKKNLRQSQSIILFAATIGIELDRLIAKYSVISPATALLLQSLGNERIEALCDAFNEDMRKKKLSQGFNLRPRFSPGYGDLPIEYQKTVFELLSPSRIGITLNDSYFMTPSKSVTAIIGVEKI